MTRSRIVILLVLLLALGGLVWWVFNATRPHVHELMPVTSAKGKVYWTCPMHPQVRLDQPVNCPICGMKLVRQVEGAAPAAAGSAADADRKALYWYDPMRPDVQFDKPGKSPFMDMQLVPKYADEANAGVVEIDPRMVQNLGMRTAPVIRGIIAPRLEAVGTVTVDERRIYAIESRAAGWIEQLDVRAVGDPVRRGQRVAGVYSPELYSAQAELVLATKSGDETLASAAQERLALLGVARAQVERVEESGRAERRAAIVAPSDGIVTELNVREGQEVASAIPLMRIADLSRVWITVEVPEAQAGSVHAGQQAEAQLRALPGRTFAGQVDYVYPRLDTATRTVSARLVFDNPIGELKPGMYAEVSLAGGAQDEALLVPSEAVIRTGTRSVVIVAEGEGRFRPVPIELGPERAGQTVVLAGLREGERVVVSGQFLIDSEASLRGAFNRMGGGEGP